MPPSSAALSAWRLAEARWEAIAPDELDSKRDAALGVVQAWLDYQEAVTPAAEAILVADQQGRFVAVNEAAADLVGCPAPVLVGRTVADITAPGLAAEQPRLWRKFLQDGTMAGQYQLAVGAGTIDVEYRARAHHPIPGFHTSRLRPRVDAGVP